MEGLILDMNGNPITDKDDRARAEAELRNFIEKHKSRFQDWFNMFGVNKRPPIKYDMKRREWFWLGD